MMVLEMHTKAIENCNNKACEILELVQVFPTNSFKEDSFPSELHSMIILDEDIIGEVRIEEDIVDKYGKTMQRFFYKDNKKFGFQENDYRLIIQIIETLQKHKNIRNKLSYEFIEKVFFEWLKQELGNEEILEPFIGYLDNRAKQNIKPMTLWVPIAFLEIETSFTVANAKICILSQEVLKKWKDDSIVLMDQENKNRVMEHFEKIKKEYLGLSCVVIEVNAEPEYALKYATEEAQRVTSILGIFSKGTWIPTVKCMSNIKGSEYAMSATVFSAKDKDNNFSMNIREIENTPIKYWRLTEKDISNINKWGLGSISSLLTSKNKTKFEELIEHYIFLYAKVAFTNEPVEKVIYMLTSLESVLLKNNSEPIIQNLSERMAFCTVVGLEERKKLIKLIKSIYSIRSSYIHHGNTSSELENISEFMEYTWSFFVKLVNNHKNYSTKDEFISAIEDIKLS